MGDNQLRFEFEIKSIWFDAQGKAMMITKAYPKSVRNVPLFDGKYDITEERYMYRR